MSDQVPDKVLGVLNIDLAKRVIHWLDAGRFKALPGVP
jgi:hypothetical protein